MAGVHVHPKTDSKRGLEWKIEQLLDEYESEKNSYEKSMDFISLENVINSKGHCFKQIMWLIIISTSVGLCGYQTYDRIAYYLTDPSSVLIEIKDEKNIEFPAVTGCTKYADPIIKEFKNHPKAKTQPYCNLDLLDFKPEEYQKLWNKRPFLMFESFKNPFGMPIIELTQLKFKSKLWFNLTYGMCTSFALREKLDYKGTISAMVINLGLNFARTCAAHEFILHPSELNPNPTLARKLAFGMTQGLKIESKRFIYRHTKRKPCINYVAHANCSNDCFSKKVAEAMNCWLPFIPFTNESIPCETTESKQARANATQVYRTLDPEKDCQCVRPCEWTYFVGSLESFQIGKPIGAPLLMVYYPDNYVEYVTEQEAYSFIKLVCDIGGNVGLYLGLSLLSILEALQAAIDIADTRGRKRH